MFYSQPMYDRHSPVQSQMTETRLVQVPVTYVPVEQGQKRILSPEMAVNAQKKWTRHQSFDMSSSQPVDLANGLEVFTLAEFMAEKRYLRVNTVITKDLQLLASKSEVQDLEDKLSAQAEEISQLRSTTETQGAQLKLVEESVSKPQMELTRTPLPEVQGQNINKHGSVGQGNDPNARRCKIVLHGIRSKSDQDLIACMMGYGLSDLQRGYC